MEEASFHGAALFSSLICASACTSMSSEGAEVIPFAPQHRACLDPPLELRGMALMGSPTRERVGQPLSAGQQRLSLRVFPTAQYHSEGAENGH